MPNSRVLPLIGLLLIWLIGGLFYINKNCCSSINNTSNETNLMDSPSTAIGSSAVIIGEDDANNLFAYSAHQLNQPLSVPFSKEIDEYLNKLIDDKTQYLKINGIYGYKEKNTSVFPNLGLARANNLKKLFLDRNIDGSRIQIDGKKMKSEDPQLVSTLTLSVLEVKPKGVFKTATEYKVQFEHNPIILYFKPGTDEVLWSAEQRESIYDLAQFMSLDSKLQVDLSCHEVSASSREKNNTLSKEKGQIVWKQLMESGMDVSRMNVIAYGQDRVISSNNTPEGKAKNSRIEISID